MPKGFRVVWKTPAESALELLLRDVDEARPTGPLETRDASSSVPDTDFMADQRSPESWDGDIAVAVDKAFARMDRSDFMMSRRDEVRRTRAREAPQPEPTLPARGPANSVRP